MNKHATSKSSAALVGFIPVVSVFLMALLMLVPLGTGVDGRLLPHLVLITVFYWLSNRPMLMPFGACALTGFFLDLWLGGPLGLNMALLILVRLFVINQLKFYRGRSRVVHWGIFALLALMLYLLSWGIVSLLSWQVLDITSVLIQWLITGFAYAPVTFILGRVRQAVF